tara:strand:+ start:9372 stop:9551 length:180 start_codon:yes stop_codon:yes gene_type:complete
MAAIVIGRVKAGKSQKSYEVKWDSASREVYVGWSGFTRCGKASSASEAMTKAEAFVYDK